MVSRKFIQRFIKACQVVVLTGNALKVEAIPGNLFEDVKFSYKEERDKAPQAFWEKIDELRKRYLAMQPNLGHFALVDLENRFEEFTLITTAYDGLHRRAGNKNIIELRGNVFQNQCQDCGQVFEGESVKKGLPVCPSCGSANIFPNVVRGEALLDRDKMKQAQRVAAEAEVFITAGFTDTNEEVKALPFIAKANGAYLLEIASEKTDFSVAMNETIIGNAAKFLTAIVLILEKI